MEATGKVAYAKKYLPNRSSNLTRRYMAGFPMAKLGIQYQLAFQDGQ